jgi:hypothetical protein
MDHRPPIAFRTATSLALVASIALPAVGLAAGARLTTRPQLGAGGRLAIVRTQLTSGPTNRGSARPAAAHQPTPRSAHGARDERRPAPAIVAIGKSSSETALSREPDARQRRRSSDPSTDLDPAARALGRADRSRADVRIALLARGQALFHEAHAPPLRSSIAADRNPS